MVKQKILIAVDDIEKRYRQADDKKKKRMKVSGAGVKTLQRIIKKKGDK